MGSGGVQGRQERRRGLQKAQTLQKLSGSRAGCGPACHSFQLTSQTCFRTYCHTLQPLPSVYVGQVGQGWGLWVCLGVGDRDAAERATGGLAGDPSTQRRPWGGSGRRGWGSSQPTTSTAQVGRKRDEPSLAGSPRKSPSKRRVYKWLLSVRIVMRAVTAVWCGRLPTTSQEGGQGRPQMS